MWFCQHLAARSASLATETRFLKKRGDRERERERESKPREIVRERGQGGGGGGGGGGRIWRREGWMQREPEQKEQRESERERDCFS